MAALCSPGGPPHPARCVDGGAGPAGRTPVSDFSKDGAKTRAVILLGVVQCSPGSPGSPLSSRSRQAKAGQGTLPFPRLPITQGPQVPCRKPEVRGEPEAVLAPDPFRPPPRHYGLLPPTPPPFTAPAVLFTPAAVAWLCFRLPHFRFRNRVSPPRIEPSTPRLGVAVLVA